MSAINRWADSSDEEDDNDEAVAILQEAPIVAPIQVSDISICSLKRFIEPLNTCFPST